MSKLLWVLYFLCLTGGLLQNFAQLLHKVADHDGFGQKAIHAASREIRRCNVLLSTKSFSSQLLGSWRFPAKLLWPTCRTSLPARVYAVKPAHGKDSSIFALSLYHERAENDRNIKIFYYCHEGFSMNFPVFIHKNYACPIPLRQWMRLFFVGAHGGRKTVGAACVTAPHGWHPS